MTDLTREPTIERIDDFDTTRVRYSLVIPTEWMRDTQFPRLQLAWWLMRLAWRANP